MSLPSNLSKWVISPFTARTKIIQTDGDSNGFATWDFLKYLLGIAQSINGVLDILGVFNGILGLSATIEGHPGTVGSIVQHLNGTGQLNSLTNVVADVNLDHIADTATFAKTTVNEVSGALTAYTSLVASGPTLNKALVWSGSAWVPSDVPVGSISGFVPPVNSPGAFNKWINSFTAATGVFTETQPDFANLSGTATAAQVPALSALTGNITAGQGPTAAFSGTIVTAQLTGPGAQGSMTFVNGILTAQTPAT